MSFAAASRGVGIDQTAAAHDRGRHALAVQEGGHRGARACVSGTLLGKRVRGSTPLDTLSVEFLIEHALVAAAPKGTGDLFAATLAARLLVGTSLAEAPRRPATPWCRR
ncbi:MAG TPA: hypothetical protein PLB41_08050 [Rubrivivax sp.]|nr:hypothetical protein [Rubrivivax sp.]